MADYDAVVIGGGHNGLVCACYLARAGLHAVVLEASDVVGGAVHTEATIPALPGFLFDTCSVVHNMINMTTVPEELDLAGAGLEYVETDPFSTSLLPDGRALRFYRSAERTCAEIERVSPRDAEAYARFIHAADPIVELALAGFRASSDRGRNLREWTRRAASLGKALRRSGALPLVSRLFSPYGALLDETFDSDGVRAGMAALAAHATAGPNVPGSGFFVLWQAAYHRYGNWHARGGSGALAAALRRRLERWGGEVRTDAPVASIETCWTRGRLGVSGVRLQGGELVAAPRVVAAIDPQRAMLSLLGPQHLPLDLVRRLHSRHRSNAVQFVVHAALDRLPPWAGAPHDTWRGMQSPAHSVGQVAQNSLEAEAGIVPRDPAVYVFTPSAIDDLLAPPGQHGAYVACAAYPARFSDGATWAERGEYESHRLLRSVEARAPGFLSAVKGVAWRHAEDWERTIDLAGGHPMHLDMTLDQMAVFRPALGLAGHRTPVAGLYLGSAGTFPTGGVSGVPGRAAAKALLADLGRRR